MASVYYGNVPLTPIVAWPPHGPSDRIQKLVARANDNASHRLIAVTSYILDLDTCRVDIRCLHCECRWKIDYSPTLTSLYGDWIFDEFVPFLGEICREECGLMVKRQLLAEYVTERLAEAGPAGVAEAELIADLIVDLEAPGGDVAAMIRRLRMEEFIGYEQETVGWRAARLEADMLEPIKTVKWLRLPPGHPMRDW